MDKILIKDELFDIRSQIDLGGTKNDSTRSYRLY